MISIYKNTEQDKTIKKLDNIEPGTWINIVSPSEQELIFVSKKTGVSLDFLKASLDEEETSRIDIEDNNMIVILDIPFTEMKIIH